MTDEQNVSPTEPLFNVSTQIEAACTFIVDDEEYKLFTFAHLNKEKEIRVRWLITREAALIKRLEAVAPEEDKRGEDLITKLRDVRVDVLTMMTDCPREIIEKLGLSAQMTILKRVGRDFGLAE
jgi:hypothetical protein